MKLYLNFALQKKKSLKICLFGNSVRQKTVTLETQFSFRRSIDPGGESQ